MKRHLSAGKIQARRLELDLARGDVAVAVAVIVTARGGTYSTKRAMRALTEAEQHGSHGTFKPFSVRPAVAEAYALALDSDDLEHANAALT